MERREVEKYYPERIEELIERIDIMVVDGQLPEREAKAKAIERLRVKYKLSERGENGRS